MLENPQESLEFDLTQNEIEEMVERSNHHINFYRVRLKTIQESLILTEDEKVKQSNQIMEAIKRETNIIKSMSSN